MKFDSETMIFFFFLKCSWITPWMQNKHIYLTGTSVGSQLFGKWIMLFIIKLDYINYTGADRVAMDILIILMGKYSMQALHKTWQWAWRRICKGNYSWYIWSQVQSQYKQTQNNLLLQKRQKQEEEEERNYLIAKVKSRSCHLHSRITTT